jgi:hypothetical protein
MPQPPERFSQEIGEPSRVRDALTQPRTYAMVAALTASLATAAVVGRETVFGDEQDPNQQQSTPTQTVNSTPRPDTSTADVKPKPSTQTPDQERRIIEGDVQTVRNLMLREGADTRRMAALAAGFSRANNYANSPVDVAATILGQNVTTGPGNVHYQLVRSRQFTEVRDDLRRDLHYNKLERLPEGLIVERRQPGERPVLYVTVRPGGALEEKYGFRTLLANEAGIVDSRQVQDDVVSILAPLQEERPAPATNHTSEQTGASAVSDAEVIAAERAAAKVEAEAQAEREQRHEQHVLARQRAAEEHRARRHEAAARERQEREAQEQRQQAADPSSSDTQPAPEALQQPTPTTPEDPAPSESSRTTPDEPAPTNTTPEEPAPEPQPDQPATTEPSPTTPEEPAPAEPAPNSSTTPITPAPTPRPDAGVPRNKLWGSDFQNESTDTVVPNVYRSINKADSVLTGDYHSIVAENGNKFLRITIPRDSGGKIRYQMVANTPEGLGREGQDLCYQVKVRVGEDLDEKTLVQNGEGFFQVSGDRFNDTSQNGPGTGNIGIGGDGKNIVYSVNLSGHVQDAGEAAGIQQGNPVGYMLGKWVLYKTRIKWSTSEEEALRQISIDGYHVTPDYTGATLPTLSENGKPVGVKFEHRDGPYAGSGVMPKSGHNTITIDYDDPSISPGETCGIGDVVTTPNPKGAPWSLAPPPPIHLPPNKPPIPTPQPPAEPAPATTTQPGHETPTPTPTELQRLVPVVPEALKSEVKWGTTTAKPMAQEWASYTEAGKNATQTTGETTSTDRISQVVLDGRLAYKIVVKGSDRDQYTSSAQRTELSQGNPGKEFDDGSGDRQLREGDEVWLAEEVYVPSDTVPGTGNNGEGFFAWNQFHDEAKGSPPIGSGFTNNSFTVGTTNSTSYGSTTTSDRWTSAPIVKDRWLKWLWHIKVSTDPNQGFVEAYGDVDGGPYRLLMPRFQGVTNKFNSHGQPGVVHLRAGIYRTWKVAGGKDSTIYFSGISTAKTKEAAEKAAGFN